MCSTPNLHPLPSVLISLPSAELHTCAALASAMRAPLADHGGIERVPLCYANSTCNAIVKNAGFMNLLKSLNNLHWIFLSAVCDCFVLIEF